MTRDLSFEGSGTGYVIVSPTGDPQVVRTREFSSGEATHLGRYELVAQEVIDLALAATEGSYTLTTSNGDTVSGRFAGRAAAGDEPGVIAFSASGPVTAGAGRLAEADGELTFTGVADLATGELRTSVSGVLSLARPRGSEQRLAVVRPREEDSDERLG